MGGGIAVDETQQATTILNGLASKSACPSSCKTYRVAVAMVVTMVPVPHSIVCMIIVF